MSWLNNAFYQQWRKHIQDKLRLIKTLDMYSGYWQVPLNEKRRYINQYKDVYQNVNRRKGNIVKIDVKQKLKKDTKRGVRVKKVSSTTELDDLQHK